MRPTHNQYAAPKIWSSTKWIALRAMCLSVLFVMHLEHSLLAEVQFTQLGMTFKYSESWVISHIEETSARLKKAASAKARRWQENPELVDLGWYIVSLGEFSSGNPRVQEILHSLMDTMGAVTVPYWVASPEQRKNILIYYACIDPKTGSALFDALVYDQQIFKLARQARENISRRTGYQFEPYTGSVHGTL